MNSKKFGLIIEDMVKKQRIPYMDAVIKYCEENDIDLSSVGPLINKPLKEKIKEEAQKLNMVEKSSTAVLPIWTVMKLTHYIWLLNYTSLPLIMIFTNTMPKLMHLLTHF